MEHSFSFGEWLTRRRKSLDLTRDEVARRVPCSISTLRQVEADDLRWQVEEPHRGIKQLTGSEKCQCRKARSQRNHLACYHHA
jgi:predicted transcriptional regulator